MKTRRIIVKMREGHALSDLLSSDNITFKAEALGQFEGDENANSHQDPFSKKNDIPEKEHYNAPFYHKLGKMDKETYRTFKIDCANEEEFRKVMDNCENQKGKVELFYEDGLIYLHAPPPNDPEFIKTQRKIYDQLGVEECWDFVRGINQIVGVIDTGVLTTHPDIAQNLWKRGTQVGYTYPNSQRMEDTAGHGTPVAGIIGGIGNNGIGIVGAAPEALVQIHKLFLRGNEEFMSQAQTAINTAKQDKLRIMNCSFGIESSFRNTEAEREFQRCINSLSDTMLFVFSSGNGTDNDLNRIDISTTFLNELPNVLKVGALDGNNQKASYSNFGRDVVYAYGDIMSTNNTNSYAMFHHTSAAAPQVSGICALLMSAFPHVPVQKIRNAILMTANHENDRVNAIGALKLLQQQESIFV